MVQLNQIIKTYNKGKANAFEALHGVSLSVKDGEMVAIMGTSGAGKSTLLHLLACIDQYDSGEYILDGEAIRNLSEKKLAYVRNEKIGIVMQDFALVEEYKVIENVLIPLDFSKKHIGWKRKRQLSMEALKMVGIEELSKKSVNKLSGGQKQRVAIARAIVNDPSLIIADEPTGALDSKTSNEIMRVFQMLNDAGKTIIIVTHDDKVASKCERIIRLEDGKILI